MQLQRVWNAISETRTLKAKREDRTSESASARERERESERERERKKGNEGPHTVHLIGEKANRASISPILLGERLQRSEAMISTSLFQAIHLI